MAPDTPLRKVAEQMRDDEQRILRSDVVIDLDLGPVQVTGEGIGHIGDADRDAITVLDPAFDAIEGRHEALLGHSWTTASISTISSGRHTSPSMISALTSAGKS